MKKLTMLFLLGLSLGSPALYAGESGDKAMSFWDKLRAKVESFTPQKKSSVTTATGGVRGALLASSDDLYWKSDASSEIMAAEELEAFTKAIKLTEANDKTRAKTAFSAFVKQYPGSALRKDADQALAMLQTANTPAQ